MNIIDRITCIKHKTNIKKSVHFLVTIGYFVSRFDNICLTNVVSINKTQVLINCKTGKEKSK